MRLECPRCGRVYNGDLCVEVEVVWCSGDRLAGRPWHARTVMVERDPYQVTLDDLGIPLDDPLRFAE